MKGVYKEIEAMIPDIEAFTELSDFLNMRLMFATGDADFQEKTTC